MAFGLNLQSEREQLDTPIQDYMEKPSVAAPRGGSALIPQRKPAAGERAIPIIKQPSRTEQAQSSATDAYPRTPTITNWDEWEQNRYLGNPRYQYNAFTPSSYDGSRVRLTNDPYLNNPFDQNLDQNPLVGLNWQDASLPNGFYSNYGTPYPVWGDDDYASKMRAWIARQEWQDYLARFAPVEEELLGMVGNKELLNSELEQADKNMQSSFRTAEQMQNIERQRYGLALNDRNAIRNKAALELEKTAATAQALNDVRAAAKDRDLAILGGGTLTNFSRNRLGG